MTLRDFLTPFLLVVIGSAVSVGIGPVSPLQGGVWGGLLFIAYGIGRDRNDEPRGGAR